MLGRRQGGVGPREAAERLARGEAVLLDVREPQEWAAGHVAGALHVPMGELSRRVGDLPLGRPIVAVCRSGNRSGMVAEALRKAGYDALNLDGGMKAWQKEGLPLEPPDGRVA